MKDYEFTDFESAAVGLDAFFASEPNMVTPHGEEQPVKVAKRVKVGSLAQLKGFRRVANDTLINKATQDLWAIKTDGGEFFIERLFDDGGSPLKG